MDEALRKAVELFNAQRFTEFQDALEAVAVRTRAASELHFYTLLGHLAEGLHQIGNAKFESAEALLQPALRKLEDYLPRFRGLNVESLREDFLQLMGALREARAAGRTELRLERWPRLTSARLTIDLVVFDLDGTLIDSGTDLAIAVNQTLASVGAPELDRARVRSFVGEGARRLIEKSIDATGLPLAVDDLLPLFLAHYREVLLLNTRLYPGVEEAVKALAPRRLAVLTNKPGDMSRAILSGLGIAHAFDWIWGAGDVPARKPDPVGLQRLMAAAEVPPERTAFVGDSAIDVRTARGAGAVAVGVTYGFDPHAFDAHPPDLRIAHPQELPRLMALPPTSGLSL